MLGISTLTGLRRPKRSLSIDSKGQEVFLRVRGLGSFRIDERFAITVSPSGPRVTADLQLAMSGPMMALFLTRMGRLVFHASAVAMGGGAVVIAGESGAGKSTLAAALHRAGERFLADDLVALTVDGPIPSIYPEGRQSRLSGHAAQMLGLSDRPFRGKRYFALGSASEVEPVPVARIVVLSEGAKLALHELTPEAAFIKLVGHTYLIEHLPPDMLKDHFERLVKVVSSVPVVEIARKAKATPLAELVEVIREIC
jgi:hypothetical protein